MKFQIMFSAEPLDRQEHRVMGEELSLNDSEARPVRCRGGTDVWFLGL